MNSCWMSLLLMAGVLQLALSARVSAAPTSKDRHRRQLPCNLPLRLVFPSLFDHCVTDCTYSNWTAWQKIQSRISTNKSMCTSKYYYTEKRTRSLLSVIGHQADCNEVNQTRKVCYPTNDELLIHGLGLGGSGQKYDSIERPPPRVITQSRMIYVNDGQWGWGRRRRRRTAIQYVTVTAPPVEKQCPPRTSSEVCEDLTASRLCRRSIGHYHDSPKKRNVKRSIQGNSVGIITDSSDPITFDWNTHGSHFRQRRETRCSDDDVQQILFVLDSSGSVGRQNFEDMKNAITKLLPLFCKQIETALINFSSDIRLEYCFNCFQNTIQGRAEAKQAIINAEYLGQCTNTGATAKCICDNILSRSCGINTTTCLDVVFITDGKSNDPNREVCNEIKCLHNQVGINTYAIGIGGYDPDELECIAHNTDDFGMFEYETFQEFTESIDNVVELVTNATLGGNYHSCSGRDRSFSPTGSTFTG